MAILDCPRNPDYRIDSLSDETSLLGVYASNDSCNRIGEGTSARCGARGGRQPAKAQRVLDNESESIAT